MFRTAAEVKKCLPLKEGLVNEIKIEVTAEDGTTKKYIVKVHRLSSKEAVLSDLKIDVGKLEPSFNPKVIEYSGMLSDFSIYFTTIKLF